MLFFKNYTPILFLNQVKSCMLSKKLKIFYNISIFVSSSDSFSKNNAEEENCQTENKRKFVVKNSFGGTYEECSIHANNGDVINNISQPSSVTHQHHYHNNQTNVVRPTPQIHKYIHVKLPKNEVSKPNRNNSATEKAKQKKSIASNKQNNVKPS